jgi:hypothetical protein
MRDRAVNNGPGMGSWLRSERELLITYRSDDPRRPTIRTNWPFYVTRLERSEGFQLTAAYGQDPADRDIEGVMDLRQFNYLHLRSRLEGRALQEFERRRGELPYQPQITDSDYRVGPYERETVFCAVKDDPYWMTVDTDMAVWQRRLDRNPYAVLVEITRYAGGDGEAHERRVYKFPRRLLTVRRNRPRHSEEHRAKLRERLLTARRG